MKELQIIRCSFIVDEIIKDNYLHKYNRKQINNIINNSTYKIDRYELEYILLHIYLKLNKKEKFTHEQQTLNNIKY
jgi:hypothetical protein